MEIQDTKQVWVVFTNTDLTEGRGRQIPLYVCELGSTAIRMGKGKGVMGSDCSVSETTAVKINNNWLYPNFLHTPTEDDRREQRKMDKKNAVLEKALGLGLTAEEILSLRG